VRLAREEGVWKIVAVDNVKQLLEKLQRQQEDRVNSPPSESIPPEGGATAPTPGP